MEKGYTLKSGKFITEDELEEIREAIHMKDDIEDVINMIEDGVFDCQGLLFGPVPKRCISEIAIDKGNYERQKSYAWDEAVEEAVSRWSENQYYRLLNLLLEAYRKLPGNEDVSEEEFENTNRMFHCRSVMANLASAEDMEIWDAVVSAEKEGE